MTFLGQIATCYKERQPRLPLFVFAPCSQGATSPIPTEGAILSGAKDLTRSQARQKRDKENAAPDRPGFSANWAYRCPELCKPLSSLDATLPNHLACVANKGLAQYLSSFRCNTYKKYGVGGSLPSVLYCLSATKIISGESSRIGVRSKFPYSAKIWNPHRASRWAIS